MDGRRREAFGQAKGKKTLLGSRARQRLVLFDYSTAKYGVEEAQGCLAPSAYLVHAPIDPFHQFGVPKRRFF